MAAACAGRVHNIHTLGEAYCNLIGASTSAGEWERAAEWCEHVEAFARAHECGATPLIGACGVAHADVLLATGRWAEAEQALTSVLDGPCRPVRPRWARPPSPRWPSCASARVACRRPSSCSKVATCSPVSLRALAQLRIAEGRPEVGAALLERGLTAAGDDVDAR